MTDVIECYCELAAARRNLRQVKVRRPAPSLAPSRLVKCIKRLIRLALAVERQAKVVKWLAVFGGSVIGREPLNRPAKMLLGLGISRLPQLPNAKRCVHARIARITHQRLF